jgi:transposase InsO family protein
LETWSILKAYKWREPDELRGSCPVLRGTEAEMPRSTHPYIRLTHGFVYLVAVMDWYSRKVLSYRISNSMHTSFCVECLEDAIRCYGIPEIMLPTQNLWVEI